MRKHGALFEHRDPSSGSRRRRNPDVIMNLLCNEELGEYPKTTRALAWCFV